MSRPSPTALRWWFAVILRRLREQAGPVSRASAGQVMKSVSGRGSESSIAHIEQGRVLPTRPVLAALLDLYEVDAGLQYNLQRLRDHAGASGKDWWIGFDEESIPEGFDLFLGIESSSPQLESFDALVPTGLLQTPEYAEAIIRDPSADLSEEEVKHALALRKARQEGVLHSSHPPKIVSVIAEGALHQRIGGTEVLRGQLHYLAALAQTPGIVIQILEFSSGAYPGEGTFTIVAPPKDFEEYHGCVYVETRTKFYYYEQMEDLRHYRNALSDLRVAAADPAKTVAILERMAKDL